jgi:23S rRNA pseudouridine1911/1915/1917 synthase
MSAKNQGWIYRDQVNHSSQGLTLLAYYSQTYRHSSPEAWQERIASGQVLLDGQPTSPDTVLQRGQQLTYHRPPWTEPEVPLDFEVLFADSDLLLINKPSGLPVLPGGGFLQHTLLGQLQRRYPQDMPYPIHRLGRGTSGLMLLARSAEARADLSQQMRQHQIRKVYRGLVGADLKNMPDQFTVSQPIGKLPHPVLGYVYGATLDGQFAQSDCRVLQRRAAPDPATLLEVAIKTGRPHQIRIHLAWFGYPLLGDPLYAEGGVPRPESERETDAKLPVPGDCGYYLHAQTVAFRHPRSGESLEFNCPPPQILQI